MNSSNEEMSYYLSDERLLKIQQSPIFNKYSIDELRELLTPEFRKRLIEQPSYTRSVWSSNNPNV